MGKIMTTGAVVHCQHGGQVVISPFDQGSGQGISPRVRVNGQFILVTGGSFPVAGCPLKLPFPAGREVDSPCVRAQFNGSTRLTSVGRSVVLDDSGGLCTNTGGQPQGATIVATVQTRVNGS